MNTSPNTGRQGQASASSQGARPDPDYALGHLPGRQTVHAVSIPQHADGRQVTYCGSERTGWKFRRLVIIGVEQHSDASEVTCGRCRVAVDACDWGA